MKKRIFIFLLLGLIFRIVISFHNYSGDVTNHMIWGEVAVKHGLRGLYEMNFEKLYGHTSPNYPPLTILLFAFLYLIKVWIYQFAWFLNIHIPFFPSNLIFFLRDFNYYPYLLKVPAILADIGIAYLTYLFAKKIIGKKISSWPLIASLLVFFNPAYFYNSAYWGQTDSIPLFFVLLSFYLLIISKKIILPGITFTLALLSKQTAVVFTPLFLLTFIQKSNFKQLTISLASNFIIFFAFFIPFYRSGHIIFYPLITYWDKILVVSGLPYTSNHAFNFWYLLTGSRKVLASSNFLLNMSNELWGYLITGLINVIILVKLIIRRSQLYDIIYAGFLIPFAIFLFLTKMHERHLILVLPFLLLATYNNKFLLISFLYISLFNFLNMYHDWWFPPLPFLQQFLKSNFIITIFTILLLGFFGISLLNYFSRNFPLGKKI